jgi:hypothetical protein
MNKPVMNEFNYIHGIQSIRTGNLSSDSLIEFEGILVVHDATYTDMGSWIHYNPSPVFVPTPGTAGILLAGLVLTCLRRKRSQR